MLLLLLLLHGCMCALLFETDQLPALSAAGVELPSNMADGGALTHTISKRVTVHEKLKALAPISGWEDKPLEPLVVATKGLPVKNVALHAQVALEAGEDYKSDHPEDPRSENQLGAVHLYSQSWAVVEDSLYYVLNTALSDENRATLVVWFSFLKLLITGLM
eukprot:COSAG01_NODE_23998_length_794_cov_1.448921_1_plen_161_part_01